MKAKAKTPLEEAVEFVKGKSIVIVGGDPRPATIERIRKALQAEEVIWALNTFKGAPADYEHLIADPDVVLVLLLIRWARFKYGELGEICRRHKKAFVRIPGGYGVHQLAEQITNKHKPEEEKVQRAVAGPARKPRRKNFTEAVATAPTVKAVVPAVPISPTSKRRVVLTDRKAKKLLRRKGSIAILPTIRELVKENREQKAEIHKQTTQLGRAVKQVTDLKKLFETAQRDLSLMQQRTQSLHNSVEEGKAKTKEHRDRISRAKEFCVNGMMFQTVVNHVRKRSLDPMTAFVVSTQAIRARLDGEDVLPIEEALELAGEVVKGIRELVSAAAEAEPRNHAAERAQRNRDMAFQAVAMRATSSPARKKKKPKQEAKSD